MTIGYKDKQRLKEFNRMSDEIKRREEERKRNKMKDARKWFLLKKGQSFCYHQISKILSVDPKFASSVISHLHKKKKIVFVGKYTCNESKKLHSFYSNNSGDYGKFLLSKKYPELMDYVIKLRKEGGSYRSIANNLKKRGCNISHTAIKNFFDGQERREVTRAEKGEQVIVLKGVKSLICPHCNKKVYFKIDAK